MQQVGEESSRLEGRRPHTRLGARGASRALEAGEGRNGNGRGSRVALRPGVRGVGCKPLASSDVRFIKFTGAVLETGRRAGRKREDPPWEAGACRLWCGC